MQPAELAISKQRLQQTAAAHGAMSDEQAGIEPLMNADDKGCEPDTTAWMPCSEGGVTRRPFI
jgi:hypothetical protein